MKVISLSGWMMAAAMSASASAPAPQPVKTYTGIVISMDPKAHEFEAQGAILGKKFNFGTPCDFILPDGAPGSAADLRAGENITVSYRDVKGVLVAERVEQHPMRFAGMIDDINNSNHTVTVYADALDRTFTSASNCQIILRNQQRGALTNLQKGNHVLVTYETPGENLLAQRIEQTSVWFTGTLKAVDLTSRRLKARTWFHVKEFKVAENCAVIVHGKPAHLSDLKPDEKLSLKYDEIKGVSIVNRIVPAEESTNDIVFDEFRVDL